MPYAPSPTRVLPRSSFAALAPILLVTAVATAQAPPATRLTAALDSAARWHLATARLAGLSVMVVRGQDTLLAGSYGMADLEHQVPVGPATVFALGSTTKQFTAAAVHQLAEQGRLDLDADVRTYLPELDTKGRSIPVWRLLDHTSGLAEYTALPAFGSLSALSLPRDTIIRLISAEPIRFEPGTEMIYNNSGFFLAALIVARVSGQSFESYLADRIFGPLGMADSRYCDERALIPHRARGYQQGRDGGFLNAGSINHTWPYGAGSICGSTRDLVRWNLALHGGRVLGPAAYRRFITPRPLVDGSAIRYASGLAVHEAHGRRTIEHGGAITGFYSMTYFYPDRATVISVAQNSQGLPPAALADSLATLVLGPPTDGGTAQPADLNGLAGRFEGRRRGGTLTATVAISDGRLRIRLGSDSTDITPVFRGDDTWVSGSRRFRFVRTGRTASELRVDLLWRRGDIYSHLRLRRQSTQ